MIRLMRIVKIIKNVNDISMPLAEPRYFSCEKKLMADSFQADMLTGIKKSAIFLSRSLMDKMYPPGIVPIKHMKKMRYFILTDY